MEQARRSQSRRPFFMAPNRERKERPQAGSANRPQRPEDTFYFRARQSGEGCGTCRARPPLGWVYG